MYGNSASGGSYNAKTIKDVESGHMASNPLSSPVSNSRGTKDELDSIQVFFFLIPFFKGDVFLMRIYL